MCARLATNEPFITEVTLDSVDDDLLMKQVFVSLEENTFVRKLSCRSCQMSRSSWKALSHALKRNKSLLQLDVSDNPCASGSMDRFAQALMANETLTSLAIDPNKCSGEGFKFFVEAIAKTKTLKHLCVSSSRGGGALESLSNERLNFFAFALDANESLESLEVTLADHNMDCNKFLQSLATRSSLKKLIIHGNLRHNTTFLLTKLQQTAPPLQELQLQGCQIQSNEMVQIFLQFFRRCTTLESLTLIELGVGPHAMALACGEFGSLTRLRNLNLSSSRFGADSVAAINRVIQRVPLTSLTLSHNAFEMPTMNALQFESSSTSDKTVAGTKSNWQFRIWCFGLISREPSMLIDGSGCLVVWCNIGRRKKIVQLFDERPLQSVGIMR